MADSNETQAQTSISQLLRAIGGSGGPGGPGLFMFRSLIVGSSTSAILGLSFAAVTATLSGPAALAFTIGSSVGFIGGTFQYYLLCLRSASQALDEYPELMYLHLKANYPLKPWKQLYSDQSRGKELMMGSWEVGSCAVAAWESARPALQELHAKREEHVLKVLSNMVVSKRVAGEEPPTVF